MKKIFVLFFILTITFSQNYKPGDHELLFMPTANTMDEGQSYFSDYQVFWLNYTYAPTNNLHLSVFSMFPMNTDFLESLSFGGKYKFYDEEKVKIAAYGTFFPKSKLFFTGSVITFGQSGESSFNGSLGAIGSLDEGEHIELAYMLGTNIEMSSSTSLLLEYTNFSTLADFDFNGFISIGIRFRSENSSWEIGGFRPLEETGGDLLLLPMLKATFIF